jgi:hypothetical protein
MKKKEAVKTVNEIGKLFYSFMEQHYKQLEKEFKKDKDIKSMTNFPTYCYLMFADTFEIFLTKNNVK